MNSEQPPNWVQRRARREFLLDSKADEVWNDVRAAVQDACDTYNEHYSPPNQPTVDYKLENGHRLRITKTVPADGLTVFHPVKETLVVAFDKAAPAITMSRDSTGTRAFRIDARETEVFAKGDDGTKVSADQLSEKILERFLFSSPTERSHPIFRSPTSQGWMG